MRIILNITRRRTGREVRRAAAAAALLLASAVATAAAPDVAAAADVAVETRLDPAPEAPPCEHGKAFTGDATPVEPGHVEVEFAYAPTWWATAGAVDRQEGQQHQLGLGVGVGLLRDVDVRLVLSWAVVHAAPEAPGAPVHGSGLADTTVAARWRFLHIAEPAIDLAVSAAFTIPTGVRASPERLGTGGEAWSLGGSIAASADWGRFTTGLEIGFSAPLQRAGSNDVGLLVCNGAVGYQALPWLQPALELNYQHEIETGEERDEQVLWTTAALVLPLDPVRVLVGARFPVLARNAAVGPMATAAVKVAF
jgi:hypothetical protein